MSEDVEPVRIRPVLYFAPVFWETDYWSESTHRWDHIAPSTPLDERPSAELEAGLDSPLIKVLEAACDEWEILPGAGMLKHGYGRSVEIVRFAFVEADADRDGIPEAMGYGWPNKLPAPNPDGSISMVWGRDISVRQLLASKQLGLLRGDVTRPYVFPVRPQGGGAVLRELGPIAPDLVRAVLASIRGLEGDSVRAVHVASTGMHLADQYISGHPVESGAAAFAARQTQKRLFRRFRRKEPPESPEVRGKP
jgi:hypothetical protein